MPLNKETKLKFYDSKEQSTLEIRISFLWNKKSGIRKTKDNICQNY